MEHMAPFCVVAAGICWGIIGLFTRQLSAYGLSPLQITFGRALVTAIAMAWEASKTGSKERMRLSQLVLLHRVLPRDPLDDAAAVPAQWLE